MTADEVNSELANLFHGADLKNCWSSMQNVMALKQRVGVFPEQGKDYASGIAKVCLAVYDRLPSSVTEQAPQPVMSLEPLKQPDYW